MVPGTKTGRRKKIETDPIASPSGTSAHVIVTPTDFIYDTQPPDDTQTFVEKIQAHGVGKSTSTRIRRLCPLRGVKSWKKIDQSIKDAVVQAVLDKFEIGEDFHTDQQAQEIIDTKAYLLYKDWRYTLKQHFEKLVEEGVDDLYSHPPTGKRSKAGKANRSLLPYNHTSGSRSFPIALSLMDAMVNLQAIAMDVGIALTQEELSWQVLGQRKNYMRGFGIGPRSYSPSNSVARSRDKQMEAMRFETEVLHKDLMKEKEECQRDHEEMIREREELMKEVEEGKKKQGRCNKNNLII
ncbi:hypothetical protein ACSBR1_029689 [Camellia fascicularis]